MMIVPHRAQFYHILWLEKGSARHFVDFNSIDITDNTILFIPQNSVNLFDKDGVYEGKAIIFTNAFFSKNENDHNFLHSSPLFSDLYDTMVLKITDEMSDLKLLMKAMESEFKKESDSAQHSILHNMLHVFLLQSERELKKQGFEELKQCPYLESLVAFKGLLETEFRNNKSVSKYASSLNISEKQLLKATTSIIDKTPKQIIDDRVILEAKRLLAHSAQAVKEIAYELGYEEPTNFIKYFRKHCNTTPAEFRENFQ